MKLILSAALGSLFCVSAFAQTATAPSSEAAASKADAVEQAQDEERLVCKNEQVIGSRQTKRVCRSADTARTYRDAGREYTKEGQKMLQEIPANSGGG